MGVNSYTFTGMGIPWYGGSFRDPGIDAPPGMSNRTYLLIQGLRLIFHQLCGTSYDDELRLTNPADKTNGSVPVFW